MPATRTSRFGFLALIVPGLLLAATGVGAGDLANGGFAGSKLGTAVLWAVLLGAFLKFVLTEGLARWQLITGQTILEGAISRLGWPVSVAFLIYLLPWSFVVGGALISACGLTMHAMVPVFEQADDAKLVFGLAQSAIGVALVWTGGYRVFEKVMTGCIVVMFLTVVTTAVLMRPSLTDIAVGLLVPRIPQLHNGGLAWTIALMGGVGGTLTIICYGYWIRERERTGAADLRTCRIDLIVGYAATALFGMAMVIIASGMTLDGKGTGLIVALADHLGEQLGPVGRWLFLIGAWAAVFSSLLGVWQAVPYIFADFWALHRHGRPAMTRGTIGVDTKGWPYRIYLLAIATIPLLQARNSFADVQKVYGIVGAAFIPMLAVVLLVLNGRRTWIGEQHRNRPVTVGVLVAVLILAVIAWLL